MRKLISALLNVLVVASALLAITFHLLGQHGRSNKMAEVCLVVLIAWFIDWFMDEPAFKPEP